MLAALVSALHNAVNVLDDAGLAAAVGGGHGYCAGTDVVGVGSERATALTAVADQRT